MRTNTCLQMQQLQQSGGMPGMPGMGGGGMPDMNTMMQMMGGMGGSMPPRHGWRWRDARYESNDANDELNGYGRWWDAPQHEWPSVIWLEQGILYQKCMMQPC